MSGARSGNLSLKNVREEQTTRSPRTRGMLRRSTTASQAVASTSRSSGVTTRSSNIRNPVSVTKINSPKPQPSTAAPSLSQPTRRSATPKPTNLNSVAASTTSSLTASAGRAVLKRRSTAVAQIRQTNTSTIKRTKLPKDTNNWLCDIPEKDTESSAVKKRNSYVSYVCCPICMLECNDTQDGKEPISVGDCGHVLCSRCANRIFTTFAKCPMCSVKIDNKQFRRLYLS